MNASSNIGRIESTCTDPPCTEPASRGYQSQGSTSRYCYYYPYVFFTHLHDHSMVKYGVASLIADTGSAVSLIQHDVWMKAFKGNISSLNGRCYMAPHWR